MAIEKLRGCGYRKVGGLYLVGPGLALPCDRLPYNITPCPTCGHKLSFTQAWTWINPVLYLEGKHEGCKDEFFCPFCNPEKLSKRTALLWVGGAFYTPESFIQEAKEVGVCKRVPFVPTEFKIGESWIFLAHKKAGTMIAEEKTSFGIVEKTVPHPAIFYAFKPERLELLIWKSEATTERILEFEERGITPVIVPDGDPDHDPKRTIWQDLKEAKKSKQKSLSEVI